MMCDLKAPPASVSSPICWLHSIIIVICILNDDEMMMMTCSVHRTMSRMIIMLVYA